MSTKNLIGLEREAAIELSEQLNDLLANYFVFYLNARGFHWNIKGEKFFELHTKFEELYNDLILKVDEIAERVLTLGGTPTHTMTDFSKVSQVQEAKAISQGRQAVQSILDAYSVIIGKQRNILAKADVLNDEGTNALMSDYIREQEKTVWMYAAYLA